MEAVDLPAAKYFSDRELACRHCGVNKTTQRLRNALDAFRELVGEAVLIDDAYRCPVHNKAVGGVPNSQHVLGNAADIRVAGITAARLYSLARKIRAFQGFGCDHHKNYIHVDVRPNFARWCYDQAGKETAWYSPPGMPIAA
jgi:uncharacterized protein YcbK (DUF882 family)